MALAKREEILYTYCEKGDGVFLVDMILIIYLTKSFQYSN